MRRTYGMIGLTFIISSLLILTPLHAVTLDVTLGQTRTVSSGEVFTEAFVRNGGVLILDGGTISNGAALTSPSVTVDPGGRFIFNSGNIHYFENWGITELYGGIQSTYTSENRGYLKYAGGNPSYSNEYGQLSLFDGTVDIYSTASNRLLWYIEASSTSGTPAIRFFTTANTLAPGSYTYTTLPNATTNSGYKTYNDFATYWSQGALLASRQVNITLWTNWPGKIWVYNYIPPTAFTSTVRTAIEIAWKSQSGRTYQVQSTTNLPGGIWNNLGLPVLCQSSTAAVCDSAYDTNKMYRVLLHH